MIDFDLSAMSSCSCCGGTVSCDDLPSELFGTVTGDYCGLCQENPPSPFPLTGGENPCTRTGSYSSGQADQCPDQRGYGVSVTLNPDGTVTISNPGGYCGPPTMTVTPDSLNPFLLQVEYDATNGNNCCEGEGGTVTLTISE